MTIQNIQREELQARIAGKVRFRLFEVLSEAHHASGHIPGAVAMPLERIGETASRFAPDREEDVVVYCASRTCQNSRIAATKLAELGYRRIRVFEGGKAEWRDAGLSLEVAP